MKYFVLGCHVLGALSSIGSSNYAALAWVLASAIYAHGAGAFK